MNKYKLCFAVVVLTYSQFNALRPFPYPTLTPQKNKMNSTSRLTSMKMLGKILPLSCSLSGYVLSRQHFCISVLSLGSKGHT